MRLSERGVALIAYFEASVSLKLSDGTTPYPDGVSKTPLRYRTVYWDKLASKPVLTVGYGTTTYDIPELQEGDVYTHEQVVAMFLNTISKYEQAVRDLVTVPLNPNQFDALVSFTYNCGREALRTSTLLSLLNGGNAKAAAKEFDRWVYAGGKKFAGLIKRRMLERQLFMTPYKEVRANLTDSRTVKTAGAAAIVSGVAAVAPAVEPAKEIASFAKEYTWAFFVALALVFIYLVYLRWDDWRKGKR